MNADLYIKRGHKKSYNRDIVGAIKDYTKAIEINSIDNFVNFHEKPHFKKLVETLGLETDNASVYCWRGREKFHMNNIDGAIQDLLKAVEIKDYCVGEQAYELLVQIFCDKKDYMKAIEYLEKLAELYNISDWEDDFIKQAYSEKDWEELIKYKNEKQNSNP